MSKPSAFVFRADDGTWCAEADASPVWACRSAATMREAFAEARAKGYAVRRAPDCDADGKCYIGV